MPRLQPPTGYVTAKDAAQMLNVSDAMLSIYVSEGKLKRHGPKDRRHKFYKITEIEALKAARTVFEEAYVPGRWRQNASSLLRRATEADMPVIVDISARVFDAHTIPPLDVRLGWLRKNPDTFHVLVNQQGQVAAYSSVLPLLPGTIERFIHGKIDAEDIAPEDVEVYAPGKPLYLYVMSLVVDPIYGEAEKREYGMRLLMGLFSFLLELASRGVEIATITARSNRPDGMRILRKILPQVHTPVPGKHLFVLDVQEAGYDIFEEYKESLALWKQAQEGE